MQTLVYKSMSNKIKHSGVVDSVADDCVTVRIVQNAACAGCKIADHCHSVTAPGRDDARKSESRVRLIDVYDPDAARRLTVGDEVVVSATTQVARRALLLGFGLPLLLMVGTLVALMQLTYDEATAALASVLVLLPYFLLLWLLRERISRHITFQLECSK